MTQAADRYELIVKDGAAAHKAGHPLTDNPYGTHVDKTAWTAGWRASREAVAEQPKEVDKQKPTQVDVVTGRYYGTLEIQEGSRAWARAHNEGTDVPECPYLEGTRSCSDWWAGTSVAQAFIKKSLVEEKLPTNDRVPLVVGARVAEHPLMPILLEVISQVTQGKGERHGGGNTPFLKQPWAHYAKLHGRGFLTGQAAKKLEEAASKRNGEAFINEMLGAIAYCGMSILHEQKICSLAAGSLVGVEVDLAEIEQRTAAVYSADAAFEDALHGKKSS